MQEFMLTEKKPTRNRIIYAVAKLVILFGLFVWMFWPEGHRIVSTMAESGERAHALVIPFMILLLGYHRRNILAAGLSNSSVWGGVFLISGLALYAIATWPFNYGYVRDFAMVPVLAGMLLATCGWKVLKLSFPMLLLVMLAIPVGSHIYARLTIRPETYTITATAAALEKLPGIYTVVRGIDIFFNSDSGSGVVALGESYRGAKLLLAFATIGVFVTFSRIRSIWRLVFVAGAAIPIILFCNFLWFFCWGILAIYMVADPASAIPRNVSTIFSLLLAYALFALVSSVSVNLFVDTEEHTCARESAGG